MINNLYLIGLNHKTAPLDLRESYLKHIGDISETLEKLKLLTQECSILSTCNRFEIIYTNHTPLKLIDLAPEHAELIEAHHYQLHGLSAAQHLFEVTASLDSLVIGETEILGQVRKAYELAETKGTVDRFFHSLFQNAIRAAKKIHSETKLGQGHVSVGSVAVDLCRQVYSHLDKENILLLGSGDIGRVVLENLKSAGARHISISSRTLKNAQTLASDLGGNTIAWEDWITQLVATDILITSTSSPETLLDESLLNDIQKKRQHKPLLIVDLAVPRNVGQDVDDLRGVYRYDMDGLSDIIDNNTSNRHSLIDDCRMKLSIEVQNLIDQNSSPDIGLVYKQLDNRIDELKSDEFEKIKHQLPTEYHSLIQESLRRFGNKILHPLKKNAPQVLESKEDLHKIFFGEDQK